MLPVPDHGPSAAERDGALAARTLLRLASGERIDSVRFELPTHLVVRDSTGPCAPTG